MPAPDDLHVIYNDECPVCRFEVDHHRAAGAPDTRFTPVREADLDALGLTEEDALRRLHAVRDGALLTGLEANRAMWAARPGTRWLAQLTGLPPVRPLATWAYDRIAAPLLYRMHRRRAARRG